MTAKASLRTRSVLFVPGGRDDLIAKLPRWKPDIVVADLEDAVAPAQKQSARRVAGAAVAQLAASGAGLTVFVRVNGPGSAWMQEDLEAAAGMPLRGVVVPKVESAQHLSAVREALSELDRPGLAVIAGIETVAGVLCAGDICEQSPAAVYFGAEDFVLDLGGRRSRQGFEVLYARSQVSLWARRHGIPAIDQAVVAIRDDEVFLQDANQGRDLGYAGKICVHPAQVVLCHDVFTPSRDEIAMALRVLAAHADAVAEGSGVAVVDGRMIDEPHVRLARSVLDSAGVAAP